MLFHHIFKLEKHPGALLKKVLSLTLVLALAAGFLIPTAKAEEPELIPLDENLIVYSQKVLEPLAEGQQLPRTVSLSYAPEVCANLKEELVRVTFKNPLRSYYDVTAKLCVLTVDEEGEEVETLIAQTGRIPAGCGIEKMDLLEDLELPENIKGARYRLDFYSPYTGDLVITNFALDEIAFGLVTE